MSFWKAVLGAATGALIAYAAVRAPAFWDAYQARPQGKQEFGGDVERERVERRQREARVALVREECGDDDRCRSAYWRAIGAWDACRKERVNLPLSCATDYDAAITRAKAFAGARPSHEH